MYIKKIDENNKSLEIAIPLTSTSGKTRVKQRDSIFGYGLPFASRQKPFNQKNYIEWQIGYDAIIPSNVNNFAIKNFKNFKYTTIKNIVFTGFNDKNKTLYELSEYIYYFAKWGIFERQTLLDLIYFLQDLTSNNLLDKHQHCQIKRTHPSTEKINELEFNVLKVEYPQLIHRFGDYEIIAEITIKEKQRAVGTQPMLYFCFPITELKSEVPLIGRCANIKEFAQFTINEDNNDILLEMIKIFGMLSESHNFDTIAILDAIITRIT